MKTPIHYLACIAMLAACSSGPEQRNKETVIKTHEELFTKGNLDFADQVFADDYYVSGPVVVKEFVGELKAAMPDLQYELQPVMAEGNLVAWKRTISGTLVKPYMGFMPTGKKISYSEIAISTFDEQGKISEETWASEIESAMYSSAGIEGVYTYAPPLQGQSIVRNGRYTFLFGPVNGKGPMVGQAGTYTLSGDTVKNVITWSSDPKQVGQGYGWMVKSWSGDTATYDIFDMKGRMIDKGRSIRISK